MQMINEKDKESAKNRSFHLYRDFLKRVFDICFSLIALAILAIPMLVIAILIKIDSPSEQILFRQQRIGKNNVPFTILKFRSMSKNAPHQMATENFKNPEPYITAVGKIIRKMSLDELPQFINVLKGDMSIIGPRPLIPKEKKVLALRSKYGADKVLPGITGLAQVNGRDELVGEKKANCDGYYAINVSFILDTKILFKTVDDVIHSRGIHEGGK